MTKLYHISFLILILLAACGTSSDKSHSAEDQITESLNQDIDSENKEIAELMDLNTEDAEGAIAIEENIGDGLDKNTIFSLPGLRYPSNHKYRVYFFNGSDRAKVQVIRLARRWTKAGEFKFEQTSSINQSHIRIKFTNSTFYYSCVGLEAENHDITMRLPEMENLEAKSFNSIVLHEFGHVLGLGHEHAHPDANFKWNTAKVLDYYKNEKNWEEKDIREQILHRYKREEVEWVEYDPFSIMHYEVPAFLITSGIPVPKNYDLSPNDIAKLKELLSKYDKIKNFYPRP